MLDVPMDETGKLANKFVDCLDQERELGEEKDHIGAELVTALKTQGRQAITVRGVTLTIKEIEAKIKIAVKRPRED